MNIHCSLHCTCKCCTSEFMVKKDVLYLLTFFKIVKGPVSRELNKHHYPAFTNKYFSLKLSDGHLFEGLGDKNNVMVI